MPGRALDVIGPPAYRCRVVAGFPKCVRRIFSGVRIGDEGDRSDMGGGYPAYDVAQSRKGNPLWNQLVKKASQLAGAASIAPAGMRDLPRFTMVNEV
jgi:hypothetical protein